MIHTHTADSHTHTHLLDISRHWRMSGACVPLQWPFFSNMSLSENRVNRAPHNPSVYPINSDFVYSLFIPVSTRWSTPFRFPICMRNISNFQPFDDLDFPFLPPTASPNRRPYRRVWARTRCWSPSPQSQKDHPPLKGDLRNYVVELSKITWEKMVWSSKGNCTTWILGDSYNPS